MEVTKDKYNLKRFIDAQRCDYEIALNELRNGRKESHWIWYIFPQLAHLGRSNLAKYYGISGADEAREYIADPVLNSRLREVCNAILDLATDNAKEVFGGIDSMKLRSSMTLFDSVSPGDIFGKVLDKYFDGKRDGRPLAILEEGNRIHGEDNLLIQE